MKLSCQIHQFLTVFFRRFYFEQKLISIRKVLQKFLYVKKFQNQLDHLSKVLSQLIRLIGGHCTNFTRYI